MNYLRTSKWFRRIAVLLVILLVFQDNVVTALAGTFQIKISLWDKEKNTALDSSGVDVALIGVGNDTIGGTGVTVDGKVSITVSANEGDQFSVSVGDAGKYLPAESNPLITVSSGDNDYKLWMQVPKHNVSFQIIGEGKITDENSQPVDGVVTIEDATGAYFTLVAEEHHHITNIVIDGKAIEKEWNNTDKQYEIFVEGGTEHSVQVTFDPDAYSLSVSGNEYGTVKIQNEQEKYFYGSQCKIEIHTADGYNVETIQKNGTDILADLQADENGGNGDYLIPVTIEEDTRVEVQYSPIEVIAWDDANLIINTDEAVSTEAVGNVERYFYRNDGTIQITGADAISLNGMKSEKMPAQYESSVEITEIQIRNQNSLKWKKVSLDKKLQLIIDKDKPQIDPFPQSEWSGAETIQINGHAKDEDNGVFPASGIDYIVYSDDSTLTTENILAGMGQRIDVSASGDFEIPISGEQQKPYYCWAIDKVGNVSDSRMVMVQIDRTSPKITNFHITDGGITSFGNYYNSEVIVTVRATDDNGSGVKYITLYLDEQFYGKEEVDENGTAAFTVPAEKILDNTFHLCKRISAKATDKVGNTTENYVMPSESNSNIKTDLLMIETIRPTISLTPNAAASYEDAEGNLFFANPIAFNLAVADMVNGQAKNSGIREVVVTVNGVTLTEDSNHKSLQRTYYRETEKVSQDTFVLHMNQVSEPEDGKYTIHVKVTDNAGNENSKTIEAFLDREAPTVVNFAFQADKYIEGNTEQLSVLATDYGFYFKQDTAVTILARDKEISSGISSLTWYTVDVNKAKSKEITQTADNNGAIHISIPAEFKGQIYARATDNVGNTSAVDVTPDSVIIESQEQHTKEEHIAINMGNGSGTDNEGKALYAGDVSVNFSVVDTWSGIRNIKWSVQPSYGGEAQAGEVSVANDGTLSGDTDWSITQKEANLALKMSRNITVQNNSNHIVLRVSMTDRAGNESSLEKTISIDKTNPAIDVSFDNMTADGEYSNIYKADRTATIVITERNFKAENVNYEIKGTDGWVPNVNLKSSSAWVEHKDDADPDKTTYTAKVPFTADGDFTMQISFADAAGNAANSPVIPEFTLDKTAPTVRVTYDNNDALHNNYYGNTRTATVTVTEHNFDEKRIHIVGTCMDNGLTKTFPQLSGWRSTGDEHSANIAYTEDGVYTFSVVGTDKAGNALSDYETENFYVDITAPEVKITNVTDKTAYNGAVAPVIEVTDTNLDTDSIEIHLAGVNNGEVVYSGKYESIYNGRRFTFDDFEYEKSVDDIYVLKVTAKDLAGHEAEVNNEVMFSVNRYGSVYTFDSPKREEILGKYIKEEQDIVFTETNVNELERSTILVKMMKNGVPTDLQEGTDYTVSAKEDEGTWSRYTYTIKKNLFAEDGTYVISVYSVDKAGNINENIADDKFFDEENKVKAEISFGIDKTAPVVVPLDLQSNSRYKTESKTASIEIKDNLLLSQVQITLNNQAVEYEMDGETYRFDIPESTKEQSVEVLAYDAAGNVGNLKIENIMVTTSSFALWLHNTPLFIGTIAGGIVVVGAVSFTGVAMGKRRKRKAATGKGNQ